MVDIGTLDTVIALVVVILLLSLIVQSIQSFIKKVLKLKSKEIEASLLDLFNAVLRDTTTTRAATTPSRETRAMPAAFAPLPNVSESAKGLLAAVKTELQELGRVNARGYFMVDSLSKSDLLNVIARIAPDKFGLTLQKAVETFAKLESAIATAKENGLPAEVSVAWAKFEGALAPLQQQFRALRTGNGVAPGLIVADVLALRDVAFDDVLELLGKVQEIAAQQKLAGLQADVAAVSAEISNARTALDAALGTFKTRLTETEQWFDTTMQGFEERYHRGMRTYAIAIAAIVVILLNANVFSVYRKIADNQVLRSNLTALAPEISELQETIAKQEADLDESSSPVTRAQLAENKEQLSDLVEMYTDVGLAPLTWHGARLWWDGLLYTNGGSGTWWSRRREDVETLFGWMLMILLLSLGAPFWHDTLESLFGVKNLLRRRNEQQNVEQARGAGNPK